MAAEVMDHPKSPHKNRSTGESNQTPTDNTRFFTNPKLQAGGKAETTNSHKTFWLPASEGEKTEGMEYVTSKNRKISKQLTGNEGSHCANSSWRPRGALSMQTAAYTERPPKAKESNHL